MGSIGKIISTQQKSINEDTRIGRGLPDAPDPADQELGPDLPSEGDAEEKWQFSMLPSGGQGGTTKTTPAASPDGPASLSYTREPTGRVPRASCVCWSPSKDGHRRWQQYESGDHQMARSEARSGKEARLASVSLVPQLCLTLCNPMDCSMPGLPVHHQLPEPTKTHVHLVGDAIQPPHPLSSPFSPAFNLSEHQGLFQ